MFVKERRIFDQPFRVENTLCMILTLLNFSPSCFGNIVFSELNPVLIDCIRLRSFELAISLLIRLSVSTGVRPLADMLSDRGTPESRRDQQAASF